MKRIGACRKEICHGCYGDPLPLHTHTHTLPIQLVLWTGYVGVRALQSRAKEREIIVNPIQCLMHPFDKPEKRRFFFLLPLLVFLSISALSSVQSTTTHRLAEVHLSFPHSRTFIQRTSPVSLPPFQKTVTSFRRNIKRSTCCNFWDRRSGDEDRFYVFLSDLDWNCICLRWGHLQQVWKFWSAQTFFFFFFFFLMKGKVELTTQTFSK